MRVFAAIRPPAHVLEHLSGALSAIEPPPTHDGPPPLRWTTPEQRHITLAFYGEVPGGVVEELAAGLADIAAEVPALQLRLAGAGTFLGRTLWAGVHQVEPAGGTELVELMAACGQLGPDGAQERQRRRAHLTLARRGARAVGRLRRSRGRRGQRMPAHAGAGELDLGEVVHALSIYRGPGWQPQEVELVGSELGAGRGGSARHEVLAVHPLAAVSAREHPGRGA